MINVLEDRNELIANMSKNAVCAEIGVFLGKFSKEIIKLADPKRLHLIDCWSLSKDLTPAVHDFTERMWEAVYDDIVELYKDEDRIEVNRGMSSDVLLTFPDDYFDWVYIDANHDYIHTLKDLQCSFLKVKKGGFILGHDMNLIGVRRAVYEMMNRKKCKMACFTKDRIYFSYGLRVIK